MEGQVGPPQLPKRKSQEKGQSPTAARAHHQSLMSAGATRTQGAITKRPFPILRKREQATSAPFRGQWSPLGRPQQLLGENQELLEFIREQVKLLPLPISASFGVVNCFVTAFLSTFDVAGLTEFLIGCFF